MIFTNKITHCFVRLYTDFDPTSIGVNINSMILSCASSTTPVVLIINEIDSVYEKVLDTTPVYDNRLQHTKNRTTFHNMLDSIEKFKYVIAIFTSEYDLAHSLIQIQNIVRSCGKVA